MMERRKKRKILALVIIFIGLVIMTFPNARLTYYDFTTSGSIEKYDRAYQSLNEELKKELNKAALEYNKSLRPDAGSVVDPFDVEDYDTKNPLNKLDPTKEIGYIYIPRIDEKLPIYLGATNRNLAKGVAQIDGTAIPLGIKGERPVLAGHRGYPRQAMFRHLDKVKDGDLFYIFTLGKMLTYKVSSVEDIYPSEYEKLMPVPGEDMVTLLTCTPYPQNIKRLLVNGVRVEEKSTDDKNLLSIVNKMKELSSINITDQGTRYSKWIIYGISFMGLIGMVVVVGLMIKTIRQRKY